MNGLTPLFTSLILRVLPSLTLSLTNTQFPLPEVVVIHQDSSSHRQLQDMNHYILEELNVRKLIVAEDDTKYGVKLTAEPDNDRLGKRLKGEFKKVAPAIKGS